MRSLLASFCSLYMYSRSPWVLRITETAVRFIRILSERLCDPAETFCSYSICGSLDAYGMLEISVCLRLSGSYWQ